MTKRQDSQLTADALNALRLEDCERYIVEWTFRILEIPGVSDDPENLMKYLCEQFESNAERDYLQIYKAKQFRAITDAFCAGHLSLADWAATSRTVLTNVYERRKKVSQQDPEVSTAIRHLYSHLMNPSDQGNRG